MLTAWLLTPGGATFIAVKTRIAFVLILMSVCVTGITGLQLYWNYQNYRSTVKTFNHDINEALNNAVDKEIDQRHQKIIIKFKSWLADTSFIQITCENNNRHRETEFHMKDTHPYKIGDKGISLGFENFKEKLNHITPHAKQAFINHFADIILRNDLKKGIVYYYTQRLGDSLNVLYEKTKLNIPALGCLYRQELLLKDINAPFKIDPSRSDHKLVYKTQTVNAALRRPYKKELVNAGFQSPDVYFLKEMKWLIISSFLLIGITIFCFAYTVKTLLSQHKLALLKDDFINNMTHEINTPLSSISITAEALKKFDHNTKTRHEYLDIISYQAEKLAALTAQILNTSRLEKAPRKNNTDIDLDELIQTAIHDLGPQIKDSNAVINYEAAKVCSIKGDAPAMLNAVVNIIDNALKYTSGPAVLTITLQCDKQHAEIIFADNGIGIPPEYEDRVFDKFFRVPKGNTHDVKGYGLGLNYVKQVIEQHKGSISIIANQPAGSTFTIKLPLS